VAIDGAGERATFVSEQLALYLGSYFILGMERATWVELAPSRLGKRDFSMATD
jgi:hypothetical protein